MSTMSWKRGNYIKFFAKMKIRVGGGTPIDIQSGDEFDYDGSILRYSGMDIPSPQLRGAVENGWVVPASLEESGDRIDTIRPNRNIAKAQTVNKDLSRVQRASGAQLTTTTLDEDEVLKVEDRGSSNKKNPKVLVGTDNRKSRGMAVSSDTTDAQEAVSIGRVRTSAKAVFNDVSRPDSIKIMQELENMSGVKADLFKDSVIQREGITITTNLGKMNSVREADDESGTVIAQVRNSSKGSFEGISVKDTSGIRNKKPGAPKISDPRLRVARAIDPSFPMDWAFTGKLAERLENIKRHGATAEFLEALYAAEGDQMRKTLVKEFPDQFEG